MIDMMMHWLRESGVDGFRCDVAGPGPDRLLGGGPRRRSRRSARTSSCSPSGARPTSWRRRSTPITPGLSTRRSIASSRSAPRPPRSARTWEEERRNFPRGSLHLRFSDNHDEKRAIARFGEPAALAAQALVFTMDGIPLVYNGMEIGDTGESGGPALTERVALFWPIVERRPEFRAVLPGR